MEPESRIDPMPVPPGGIPELEEPEETAAPSAALSPEPSALSADGGEDEVYVFPASFAQQRLWFLDRLDPGSPAYNLYNPLLLAGELRVDVLGRTLNEIVARHETLRTTFATQQGEPVQVIAPEAEVRLPLIDLTGLPTERRAFELAALSAAEARRPFDLARGPLLRVTLVRLDTAEHAVLFNLHHIVGDGWSMSVLVREVGALYTAFAAGEPSPLPDLPLQYADFAQAQREWLQGEVLSEQLAYWQRQLAGLAPLELPTDRPRPALRTTRGGGRGILLPAGAAAPLAELARRHGTTLFVALLAGVQTLLHRYTGSDDVAVGTVVAGRNHLDTEGMIGFFVNTLVMRTDLAGGPSFDELLARAHAAALGAFAHQELPFERLVEELQPQRDLTRAPFFDVLLMLQNTPSRAVELPALSLHPIGGGEAGAALFDWMFNAVESDGALIVSLTYSLDLFTSATAGRALQHLGNLLRAAAAAPGMRIDDLPLLDAGERAQVLVEWNDNRQVPAWETPVHELFRAQVERTPDRTALEWGNGVRSYGGLARRVSRLAWRLRALGVGPDVPVGVCAGRGPDLAEALLAILEAGGIYLPLDPAYPRDRLAYMMEDAGAPVVLVEERCRGSLPAAAAARLVLLGGPEEEVDGGGLPPVTVGPDHLAYIVYTSGSTGRPKGMGQTHRTLSNLTCWQIAHSLGAGATAKTLQFSSTSFDVSLQETFATWCAGGTLVPAPEEARRDPALLLRLLTEAGVERLFLPYVALQQLAETVETAGVDAVPTSLREVLTAGERLRVTPQIVALFARPGTVLRNQYGPSETAVTTDFILVGDPASWPPLPPIGRAIGDTQTYLLDRSLQPVPVGVTGELAVGGVSLARGYIGRPDLTAERFIPDGFGGLPGARLYLTGDLARWRGDGEVEFLGRVDHQVKIRGFRVEPGEIETLLGRHPAVGGCVVVAREERAGFPRLVAYVVGRDSLIPSSAELRAMLRQELPDYMVPSAFVMLPALPLTATGKVDRRRLPAPEGERGEATERVFVAPRDLLEEGIAGVWRDVLGLERIGIHDVFFELGGHSLSATRVTSRLRATFGTDLPLRALFESPTVAGLADQIRRELRREEGTEAPPLIADPADRWRAPLSFAQQRLWFLDRLETGSTVYNLRTAVRLGGGLDLPAFTRALGEVVRRHDTLRTRLVEVEGEPAQMVAPAAAAESYVLPLVDLAGLTGLGERAGAEAERLAAALTGLPFDLARGPLFRPAMLRLSGSFVLVAAMHHVVSDAWSMGILVRELAALYEAFRAGLPSPLRELPVQYSDFARWQRRWLSGEVLAAELAWWRQRLAGLPARLELPTDRPRPPVQTLRGTARFFEIRPELGEGIAALALREGATPFMVLLAVFQALMSRWSGQEDFAVGTPIAGRTRVEVEELIGFFVNNLALRADLGGEPAVRELVARARATALVAYAHQDLPFEKLVEELAPERSLSHSPIFQVVLGLQTAPDGSVGGVGGAGALLEALEVASTTAKYDLLVSLAHAGAGFAGLAEYNTDLFDDATIGRLLGHFETLLAAAVADPAQRLLEAPLLAPAERRQTLEEWSGTVTAYPRQATVHRLFEEQAELQPDAVALSSPEGEISYGELEARANRLAHALREAGVGPEVLVGLCAERSADLVTGMLAILKAGGAYVPLDPSYPLERLAFLLDDAFMPVVLAQERVADRLPAGPMTRLLLLDGEGPAGEEWSDSRPEPAALAESPVYVLYTSGSTGEPKGVTAVHRGVVRLVRDTDFARFGPAEVFLQLAPVSFDASTLEIWGPLLHGGRLVLPPPGPTSLAELGGLLAAHGVTALWLTAGLFHEMVDSRLAGLAPVRQLLAGGDVLSPVHVLRVLAGLPGTRLINGYGPTEGTTFTCCHPMTGPVDVGPAVSIGRPIANTTVYLLDRRGLPVPPGVAGELAIGGDGLARGYLNRPGATAERWRPDGASGKPGERLYHSGDLAKYLPDGRIEFFGRLDQQVKIRGFRIEPGEVEAALARHSAVRESVVMAREDRPGDRRLVAYVVTGGVTGGPGGEELERELRAFLGERLPAHLVPAHVVFLAALPLTPNGKVDRRALPAPDAAGPGPGAAAAPRDAIEEELAAVWSEVLGRTPIGVHDNFFELGGHSLLAVRVISQVRDRFGVELPLRTLFEEPTVASLAVHLRQADPAASTAEAPPLRPLLRNLRPGEEVFPLSFAQQRLWFLDRLEPESAVYNMPLVVQLEGFLDAGVLERSLAAIIGRHETLRTTFRLAAGIGGEGVQAVSPPADFSLPIVDLGELAAAALHEARRVIDDDARRPFDLERGPLFRPCLVRLAANDHVVLASMHHIISDGWSLSVLVRELVALYAAFGAGRPSPLPELPLQYADYSVWQRNWLSGEVLEAEIDWWRERLAGLPPSLELPTDRPRPATQTYAGSVRPVRLGEEASAALFELALAAGGTLFMALLAAFQALLARWAGQEDFALGSPVAGRNRSELEDLIGFFVNTLVLRTDLAGGPGFGELLERTRQRTLEAYAHQEVPFEKLVEELRPERSLARPPIFQAVFVLQNTPGMGVDLPGLRVSSSGWGETRTAKFDLTLSLSQTGDSVSGSLEYNTDLFDGTTIDRLAGRLERLIAAVVADPDTPVGALALLSAAERHQLLLEWPEWNDGGAAGGQRAPAHLADLARWLPGVGIELPVPADPRRKARARVAPARVAPRTPTEELLASLWSQLLGREPAGVHAHFFELGGHSLLAMRLASRIADLFDVELPLRLIFEAPTIEALAGRIDAILRTGGGQPAPPILPVPRTGHLPLSFAQERLWFLDRLEPGQAVYNVPFSVRLAGTEPRVLAAALTEVVRRHEALRTTFPLFEGRPYQEIAPAAEVPLPVVDLRGLPPMRRGAETGARLSIEALRPFDLERGPLLRFLVFLVDEGDLVLSLGLHHSISDGWSMEVLRAELTALYAAFSRGLPSPLPELPVQYADFAVWQRQWLAGEELERQIAFWRRELAGAPGLLELPTDRPRPPVQSFRGVSLPFLLPDETARALKTLGRRRGTTLFMTLLAAFQALLHRLSGQSVIPVGTPVANRTHSEIERLIGFFVNTLVLPADLGDDPPFTELLARVRETSLEAHAHQDLPFEKLVEVLEPERSLSHSPLFQVMLSFQTLAGAEAMAEDVEGEGGPGLRLVETPLGFAKFDLQLTLMAAAGTLTGTLTYATDLFDTVTAVRLTDQLAALLAAIADVAEQPEVRPSEIPLLSAAQRQQLLREWNDPTARPASGPCLHAFVEAQADRTPEGVAIRFGDERLTYDELDAQANRLAHRLRGWGVGPEVPVAVFMDRSLEMVVALLGVLKAGGAYVPLDPSWPRERVSFMLADCQAPVLLTQDWLVERLPEAAPCRRLALDPSFEILEDEDETRPVVPVVPANLAYVIYTSGSTGTPKGVAITHASAAALLEWAAGEFTAEELAGTLASTSICFDLSVFELFVPLSRGGCVLLVENVLSLLETAGEVGGQAVTLINTVPSAAAELVRATPLPPSVLTVNLAGEPILPGLVLQLHSQPGLQRLLNLYGPSEDTTYSTIEETAPPTSLEGAVPPAIGRPLPGTRAYVLDARLAPVPPGVPGELYLGGRGLARGYFRRPEMTAERFVPDPFAAAMFAIATEGTGERLYRTGDRARHLADGRLEFLGRVDHQIKLRGFRIELGEIESALALHPGVRQAVAGVRERGIVVWYEPATEDTPEAPGLRDWLASRLPSYMIPAALVPLPALPLTPTGKIDRRSLPDAGFAATAGGATPRDVLELALVRLWEEVLGRGPVGIHDDFFQLGGHSLMAVRLLALVRERFGRDLPLASLFRAPTIEQLALVLRVQEALAEEKGRGALVEITPPRPDRRPLFFIHPVGGNVLCYFDLARALGPDQPFYGLQLPSAPALRSIEEMAAHYLEAVRAVQPQGPYLLGGWSIGGAVAFEMARQLAMMGTVGTTGEEAGLLVLIDTPRPFREWEVWEVDEPRLISLFAQDLAATQGRDFAVTMSVAELLELSPEERLQRVLAEAQAARLLPPGISVAEAERLFAKYRTIQEAVKKYQPGSWPGRAVALLATDRAVGEREDPATGWPELITGGLAIERIEGDHYSILRRPGVDDLAARLAAHLASSGAEGDEA